MDNLKQYVEGHTPGPWKWAYGGLDSGKEPETREEFLEWCGTIWDKTIDRGEHINCVFDDSEEMVIAITGNGPCGEANAKLIMNAPAMLEMINEDSR